MGEYYEDKISKEQKLTFSSLKDSFEENNLSFTRKVMRLLGLVSKMGEYTNLAYLLSDQSEVVVEIYVYDIQMNLKLRKDFKGSLITILEKVEQQCKLLNDLKVVIDGSSFKRKETLSYPEATLREMIINAICNADYFVGEVIKIEFYADKVKITSPGGSITDSKGEEMNGFQICRNPRLGHILDKLGLIGYFEMGIPKILEAYKEFDVKAKFKNSGDFFMVTLPNVNNSDDDQLKAIKINDNIDDLDLEILRLIRAIPEIDIIMLCDRLKLKESSATVDRIRDWLRGNLTKYVEYRGLNQARGYYFKEDVIL